MLYEGKYRIESTRLRRWNYSTPSLYYVTICTQNRKHYFGDIVKMQDQPRMVLSKIGEIVDECWQAIPEHFPSVRLDCYVIMPNHIHGIIEISNAVETQDIACMRQTQNIASLPQNAPTRPTSLSSVIRGFKIGVTKCTKNDRLPFAWEARFYEHIVRGDFDLNRIRDYILTNPANWDKDTENV